MAASDSTDIPVILHTPRLTLRMADPDSLADCKRIISLHSDANAGSSGQNRMGVTSIGAVREKHRIYGPRSRPDLCTLAPPPRGMYFFIYDPALPAAGENGQPEQQTTGSNDTNDPGAFVGEVSLTFRPEMPYPDLGYGVVAAYQGRGYASEAGRRVLEWWRDVIGVKEMWAGALPDNVRSQRCSERIGFVFAGYLDVVYGNSPGEAKRMKDVWGLVLPGMEGRWPRGITLYPTIAAAAGQEGATVE